MKGEDDMAGTREYEDLNKNLEMVDGHAVKGLSGFGGVISGLNSSCA